MEKPLISGDNIVIPSDTIYLAAVDEFITGKLSHLKVPNSVIADIAISVSELVNNAIIHGNAGDAGKKVTVRLELTGDKINVYIKDQGRGFNPDSVPNPTRKENLLKKVGRGIFIVRSLVDEVDFNFTDKGTEVVLTKIIRED
jgi:serine/threonine-protein kinase RsbW